VCREVRIEGGTRYSIVVDEEVIFRGCLTVVLVAESVLAVAVMIYLFT